MNAKTAWHTLISAEELAAAIDRCVVVDCRHDLMDPDAGRRSYEEGHIPGSFFMHTDTQLSGSKNGHNGRHPWPGREAFIRSLEALGLDDDRQLVAVDAQGGQMAARLWGLARWIGHQNVAVLDGSLKAWQDAGFPLTADATPEPVPGHLSRERPPLLGLVDADAVLRQVNTPDMLLVDARAPDRFAGTIEPMDPVAGHIPGALNRFYGRNLRPDGRFKPAEVLRAEFEELLDGRAPEVVVSQCGSGITALHNVLAMEHAGLSGAKLYPGSWSEWISDPKRPVVTASH